MLKKYVISPYILVALAIILGGVLRIIFLDRIPGGIANDELQYILNAKSFFQTGTDLTKTISVLSPFLFHYPKGVPPQAELSYLMLTYIIGPLPFSLFNARITGALLSTATIFVSYLIGKKLFNEKVGIITAFVFALNPWLIYIGRTAYEMTPAMFFYLLGFYILLITNKGKILIALPLFILGFYSYIGTKLLFFPLIVITCLYMWQSKHKDKNYYVILTFAAFIFTVLSGLALFNNAGSRTNEILTPFSPVIAKQVNALRLVTMHNPLSSLFINKPFIYILALFTKGLEAISPGYLFLSGDLFFSLFHQGLFYLIDFVFITWGLLTIFEKHNKEFILLMCLALIGLIPQMLHYQSSNFTPHITMMIPFTLFFAAYGIYAATNYLNSKFKHKNILSSLVITIFYVLSLGNLIVIYFFQFPLGGFFDFPQHVLSQYITLTEQSHRQVIIVSEHKNDLIPELLFYTTNSATTMQRVYAASHLDGPTRMGSVTVESCGDFKKATNVNNTYIIDAICGFKNIAGPALQIPELKDGGGVYRIYHDSICSKYSLSLYPQNISLTLLRLSSLSPQQFCTTFITGT